MPVLYRNPIIDSVPLAQDFASTVLANATRGGGIRSLTVAECMWNYQWESIAELLGIGPRLKALRTLRSVDGQTRWDYHVDLSELLELADLPDEL